jgi:ATP-binding cassette subfamily B (MDR/TAP) protein 1
MHTGERQAAKMRLAYLRAMLDQDIAVFDTEASTGEVINAITSDILVVQDAISEKVRPRDLTLPCYYLRALPFSPWRAALPTAALSRSGEAEGGKDERN